ncbi:cupin domain-containing protein [Hymenobacter sp. 5516J-16]|uniref:cupin domain-containing protein n=1 Tax=Hymenobacter sp. 5516J-16 TaxID=2932253 RepID=UPI001FD07861|nr:cupin domain-containing protein [Hymenobacter sp. 5516J-16]UOQ76631.1 cupin domain-containing protein [Hymenobacter sp. 5516J-16]
MLNPAFPTTARPAWLTVGPGVQRQILAYGPELMLVKVAFEAGGIGARHHHVHSQITYVESGVFRCTVGEEERVLRAGDTFYAAPNVWHGVECLEAGVLLDSFSPMREDFV